MPDTTAEAAPAKIEPSILIRRLKLASARSREWIRNLGFIGTIRVSTAAAGAIALIAVLMISSSPTRPDRFVAAIIAGVCLLAASLAAIAARYLEQIDALELPEAAALCQGARLLAWVLGLAALSIGLAWAEQQTALRVLYLVLFFINAALCYGLLSAAAARRRSSRELPIRSRRPFGTWEPAQYSRQHSRRRGTATRDRLAFHRALTVVRRSLEPLAIGLCLVGWLSTSLTVVGIEEQGLVERLGVPVQGQPLMPGLHLHWPWPVDRVFRIPVQRVQALNRRPRGRGSKRDPRTSCGPASMPPTNTLFCWAMAATSSPSMPPCNTASTTRGPGGTTPESGRCAAGHCLSRGDEIHC